MKNGALIVVLVIVVIAVGVMFIVSTMRQKKVENELAQAGGGMNPQGSNSSGLMFNGIDVVGALSGLFGSFGKDDDEESSNTSTNDSSSEGYNNSNQPPPGFPTFNLGVDSSSWGFNN